MHKIRPEKSDQAIGPELQVTFFFASQYMTMTNQIKKFYLGKFHNINKMIQLLHNFRIYKINLYGQKQISNTLEFKEKIIDQFKWFTYMLIAIVLNG
jgi:hypothetical protein